MFEVLSYTKQSSSLNNSKTNIATVMFVNVFKIITWVLKKWSCLFQSNSNVTINNLCFLSIST